MLLLEKLSLSHSWKELYCSEMAWLKWSKMAFIRGEMTEALDPLSRGEMKVFMSFVLFLKNIESERQVQLRSAWYFFHTFMGCSIFFLNLLVICGLKFKICGLKFNFNLGFLILV